LKNKIDQVQCTFMSWVTKEELHEVLDKFAEEIAIVKDTAGAKSKYTCLLCGKPRTHVSGMIRTSASDDGEEDELPKSGSRPAAGTGRPNTATPRLRMPTDRPKRPHPRDVVQLVCLDHASK
jgi:hypothetical protein